MPILLMKTNINVFKFSHLTFDFDLQVSNLSWLNLNKFGCLYEKKIGSERSRQTMDFLQEILSRGKIFYKLFFMSKLLLQSFPHLCQIQGSLNLGY